MLINRGCKTSLVKPTPNRIAIYLPYRSGVLDNIKQQIFSEPNTKEVTVRSPSPKIDQISSSNKM